MNDVVRLIRFKQEISDVCKKYNLAIVPEDEQVCLELVTYSSENMERLLSTSINFLGSEENI